MSFWSQKPARGCLPLTRGPSNLQRLSNSELQGSLPCQPPSLRAAPAPQACAAAAALETRSNRKQAAASLECSTSALALPQPQPQPQPAPCTGAGVLEMQDSLVLHCLPHPSWATALPLPFPPAVKIGCNYKTFADSPAETWSLPGTDASYRSQQVRPAPPTCQQLLSLPHPLQLLLVSFC